MNVKLFAITLSLTLLLATPAHTQPPNKDLHRILDATLQLAQENSLAKTKIDWQHLKKDMYALSKSATHLDSLLALYKIFFERINDFHGGIQHKDQWINWKAGEPEQYTNGVVNAAVKKSPSLVVKRWGEIGYYRVPGGTTKNVSFVTQMLVDSLCKIDPSTVKGWILDLRLNTGGNVWFNLASLATLIGGGVIGGSADGNGKIVTNTIIKDGKPYGNNQYYTIPEQTCTLPNHHVPVVLLTSHRTASSAEALLLAFKGRPQTLTVGEPTAGFITSNNSFPLDDDLTLILATGYMIDRQNNIHTKSIAPDVQLLGGDNFENLSQDKKIRTGIEWLTKQIR